jgi:RimJ/RimL family protein N-acetyltransferase
MSIGKIKKADYYDLLRYFIIKTERGDSIGIIGLYSYHDYPDDAWIGWFGILPEYRGKGFSKMALAKLERHARSLGFKSIRLYLYEGENAAADGLYKNGGFFSEPYRGKDGIPGHDIYIYSKSLSGFKVPEWGGKYLHLDDQVEMERQGEEMESAAGVSVAAAALRQRSYRLA